MKLVYLIEKNINVSYSGDGVVNVSVGVIIYTHILLLPSPQLPPPLLPPPLLLPLQVLGHQASMANHSHNARGQNHH